MSILGLLLGLGAELVPVASATGTEGLDQRGALSSSVNADLAEALAKVDRRQSLASLEQSLAVELRDPAAAEALIRVLYGELLRMYRYDVRPQAVIIAGSAPTSGTASLAGAMDKRFATLYRPRTVLVTKAATQSERADFRSIYPAIQPLGP